MSPIFRDTPASLPQPCGASAVAGHKPSPKFVECRMNRPSAHQRHDHEALLAQARAGDSRGFEAVYRSQYPVVLAFLGKRIAEPELAADLLAETFAALFELVQDEQRPLPASPVAWLLLTARHLLIDSYRCGQVEATARRRLRMRPVLLEDSDLARITEISHRVSLIEELEAQLPADQAQALCARVLDERDYPEIARQLRCSEAVVRKRVSRALGTLKRNAAEAESHA